MIALDLFRGAGGWSVACQQLGIVDLGVEKMREANATAHAAGHAFAWDDVWEPATPLRSGFVDGLIASPPCQTFSKAGKGAGRKALLTVTDAIHDDTWRDLAGLRELGTRVGDERTALVLTPLYYWFMLQPEWVAFEQVPTVLPVWEEMSHVMREHGYHVWTGCLQAEQYGVPQTRKRAFLLAHRDRGVEPPIPTHSKYYPRDPKRRDPGVASWISMAEALGYHELERVGFPRNADAQDSLLTVDGQELRARDFRTADQPANTVTEKARSWGRYAPEFFQATNDRPNVARRGLDQPAPTLAFGHETPRWVLRNNSSANAAERDPEQPAPTLYFGDRTNYCAWEWRGEGEPHELPEWAFNRPSTTIVGSFRPEVVASPGYRTTVSRQDAPHSVQVSIEEAGVLQSFPADYPWQGSKSKKFLQCGNAVPPQLAAAVLSSVALDNSNTEDGAA